MDTTKCISAWQINSPRSILLNDLFYDHSISRSLMVFHDKEKGASFYLRHKRIF